MCARCMLHAVVTATLLVTVWTLMYDVLAGIHTEWNQAATNPASNNSNDEACHPGERASLIECGGYHISLTELALDAHW